MFDWIRGVRKGIEFSGQKRLFWLIEPEAGSSRREKDDSFVESARFPDSGRRCLRDSFVVFMGIARCPIREPRCVLPPLHDP